jgi:multiple sugar transport system substrate-binding protein
MYAKTSIRLLAGTGVVAVALGVTGCTSPFGVADDPNALTMFAVDAGEDNAALEGIVAAYEDQSDGITVDVTYIPEDTYVTKLQTASLADSPDIANIYNTGLMFDFLPLNDSVYDANGISIDDFNAALPNFCGWEGTVYCVGSSVGNMVLFYNKALFDAAGVAYPDASTPLTFDEFADLASKLTQPGADEASTVWGAGAATLLAYLDPADVLDETGRIVEATKSEFVGTVETLAGMAAAGDMPSVAQAEAVGGAEGATALFLEGKLAMYVADNYVIGSAEAAGIDFGLAPTPVVAGSEPWIVTWTNAFGIPKGAKNPEASADFLAFLATAGQEAEAEGGHMPLGIAAAETWATTEVRQELLQVSRLVRPSVFNPNQWAWNSPLLDAYEAALRGEPVMPLLEAAQPNAQQANDVTWDNFDQMLAALDG